MPNRAGAASLTFSENELFQTYKDIKIFYPNLELLELKN